MDERLEVVSLRYSVPPTWGRFFMNWIATFRSFAIAAAFAVSLGGCSAADLAKHDREVRATWSTLMAVDGINIGLARRLLEGQHAAITGRPELARQISDAVRDLPDRPSHQPADFDNARSLARYIDAHERLVSGLEILLQSLGRRGTPMQAWRSRSLQRETEYAVLRARAALSSYNTAAAAYNRALGSRNANLSKALLYPGLRRLALLGGTP